MISAGEFGALPCARRFGISQPTCDAQGPSGAQTEDRDGREFDRYHGHVRAGTFADATHQNPSDQHGDRSMPPQFDAPGNIVFVTLDSGITEAFINGTQPGGEEGAAPAAGVETAPPPVAPAAAQ